jgi:hypothetical protein
VSTLIEALAAAGTLAAVIVALRTSHRALAAERRSLQVEGRRQVAMELARWLQSAETGILRWHDPENWRIPADTIFPPGSELQPGDVMPPSQGRMGPSIEAAIVEFESVRGLTRLAFGSEHEVSRLLAEVIQAIQVVADRGVIYAAEPGVPTPREYVDRTFVSLARDLFEALAEESELRGDGRRQPRSGVTASDNLPPGWLDRDEAPTPA